MLSQKNSEIIELKAKYENDLAENDENWKTRLDVAQSTCKEKLKHSYAEIIERLKLTHAEEIQSSQNSMRMLEAHINSLNKANEEKSEALLDKDNALETLSNECKRHLDILEACKRPYIDQINQLRGVVAVQENSIDELQRASRHNLKSLNEAREANQKLQEEHRNRIQQEKDDYQSKVRSLQNEISRLRSDSNALRLKCSENSSTISDMVRQHHSEKQHALDSQKQQLEDRYKQQETRLRELYESEKTVGIEVLAKLKDCMQHEKELEEKHDIEKETIRREMKQKYDQREADIKKKLHEDMQESCDRCEQNVRSLLSSQNEHSLRMLRRKLEGEVDEQKHAKTLLEKQLSSLKEQHERAADNEREQRQRLSEQAQRLDEAKQQLERVKMEHKETERNIR